MILKNQNTIAFFKEAFFTILIASLLFFHLLGLRTVDQPDGLSIKFDLVTFALAVSGVCALRLIFALSKKFLPHLKTTEDKKQTPHALYGRVMLALLAFAIIFPFTPFSSRYVLDVGTLILTYMVLAYSLNIVVGYAGLLDLGFAAFYGLGAYAYALLSQYTGLGFWSSLPLAAIISGGAAFLLGLCVLRLRGDYLAVVTLGFAEILRVVLLNWVSLTGGPNGINGIARPTLFGLSFERVPPAGAPSFHDFFGLPFESSTRVLFLYYLVLALVLIVYVVTQRLRKLPLGRALEATREDELAAQAVGMNVTRIRLAGYVMAGCLGSLAGAFFAARQGFISPESFTFTESAMILAIVILGGVGHPLGIALAALFLVGLPEIFRDLQDYRLIAFGAGMIIIMLLRPGGLFSKRRSAVTL